MIKPLTLFILLLVSLNANANKILEIYFDTPELHLLKSNASLKYQAQEYLSKKNRLKYHENIIYASDANQSKIFPVKHYSAVKSLEEKHPLLALIKRDERELFLSMLKENGIPYPLKLKYILQTTDTNTSYKELFARQAKKDKLFSLRLRYPYLVNLLYGAITATIGLLLIFLLFRKRLKL